MKTGLWSQIEDDIALHMRRTGSTLSQIAERLGRGKDSVRHRMALHRRNGLDVGEFKRGPSPNWKVSHAKLKHIPQGPTSMDVERRQNDIAGCRLHLVDLMREYTLHGTLGMAKAMYRSRNELDIPPGADLRPTMTPTQPASYCGSSAALAAGY